MSIAVFILLASFPVAVNATNTFIFQFDNASNPDFDFVGLEAGGVSIRFGQDFLDAGEAFSFAAGSSPGSNDLAFRAMNGPFGFDIPQGLGLAPGLNLVPSSDIFFTTISVLNGSFTISEMSIAFGSDGVFEVFDGRQLRDVGAVPEPATWLMMILGFASIGLVMQRRSKYLQLS